MSRLRKESREAAIVRADRAESRARAHVWALGYLMRTPSAIQWYERPEWRLGVCPAQPNSGLRVVIVFERDSGRVYPDGAYHGDWRVEFLEDLQAWRRSAGAYASLTGENIAESTRALADLLDEITRTVAREAL